MATVVEEAHDASCLMKKWVNGLCTLEGMVKIVWAFGVLEPLKMALGKLKIKVPLMIMMTWLMKSNPWS